MLGSGFRGVAYGVSAFLAISCPAVPPTCFCPIEGKALEAHFGKRGVAQNQGYHSGDPGSKDNGIFGSILGSSGSPPIVGNYKINTTRVEALRLKACGLGFFASWRENTFSSHTKHQPNP